MDADFPRGAGSIDGGVGRVTETWCVLAIGEIHGGRGVGDCSEGERGVGGAMKSRAWCRGRHDDFLPRGRGVACGRGNEGQGAGHNRSKFTGDPLNLGISRRFVEGH